MKKDLLIVTCFLLTISFLASAFRTDDWLTSILSRLDDARIKYPQEKIHVHFDKPSYSMGEDIWLKAYVVNSEHNELSALSKVMYVDVVDERDSVRQTLTLPVVNGLANGDLKLNDSLFGAGIYTIKAYTRWMRNFGGENFFSQDVSILNGSGESASQANARFEPQSFKDSPQGAKQTATLQQAEDSLRKVHVRFFPEGGRLVTGLRSRVAFKATAVNGRSANVQGYITDQTGEHLADLRVTHAGMGVFAIQPASNHVYSAVLTDDEGTVRRRYPLPPADKEGYVLSVNHSANDSVTVTISASNNVENREIALIGQQNGVVNYATLLKMDGRVLSTKLSEARFSTGIIAFTLLMPTGQPLAERLLFVNHNDQLQATVITEKPVYHKRESVSLNLAINDSKGAPIQSNFSVAVTYDRQNNSKEQQPPGIYANLLLTSDLKGFVENPNYYFNGSSASKVRDLDYLLLTQGWRRFTWLNPNGALPPLLTFKPQKTLDISGRITTNSNKPISHGRVSLFAATPQGPILADTVADANGDFTIADLEFTGNINVIVNGKKANGDNNVRVTLHRQTRPAYKTIHPPYYSRETSYAVDYESSAQKPPDGATESMLNKTIRLKEVNVREKKSHKAKFIQGSFKSTTADADIVLTKDDIKWRPNVLQSFYGLTGIYVKDGRPYSTRGGAMDVRVNGSLVSPGFLMQLSPLDVEGIEIMRTPGNSVTYGGTPTVEVTLNNRYTLQRSTSASDNAGRALMHGYTAQREFYSPPYDQAADTKTGPDLRTTIYWNPNVVSDAAGKATVKFFTGDKPGTYRVFVQGIDIDGRLAQQEYNFKVN